MHAPSTLLSTAPRSRRNGVLAPHRPARPFAWAASVQPSKAAGLLHCPAKIRLAARIKYATATTSPIAAPSSKTAPSSAFAVTTSAAVQHKTNAKPYRGAPSTVAARALPQRAKPSPPKQPAAPRADAYGSNRTRVQLLRKRAICRVRSHAMSALPEVDASHHAKKARVRLYWSRLRTSSMRTGLIGLVLATSTCYSPNFEACTIRCTQSTQCPSGLTCNAQQICAGPNQGCSPTTANDARTNDSAKQYHCVGVAAACTSLKTDSRCAVQQGCRYAPLSCTNTTNCAIETRNCSSILMCRLADENGTQVCLPRDDYCTGSTQDECEGIDGCSFSGGCTGTVTACQLLPDEAVCRAQLGCTWQ